MMHLGHGHRPMLCIVASNTLEGVKTIPGEQRQDSLFGIIGSLIGEYSRIKPAINAITTIRKMGRCWHDQSDITNRYLNDFINNYLETIIIADQTGAMMLHV